MRWCALCGPCGGDHSDQSQEPWADIRTKVKRNVIPVLLAVALLCYIDRSNLSYAALQMNHDLGFSEHTYGTGSGIFFFGYLMFEVPSNVMLARYGAPMWLARILVTWGACASCMALIQTPTSFYVLRFALGLAEAGAFPGIMYYLTLWFDESEYGEAYTTIASGAAASGVAGGLLAAGIFQMDGVLGLRGWRWLFLIEGVPSVLLGLCLPLLLPRDPMSARFLTSDEKRRLAQRQGCTGEGAAEGAEEQAAGPPGAPGTWHLAVRNWRVWYLGLVWALALCSYYGVLFFGPLIARTIVTASGDHPAEPDNTAPALVALTALPYLVAIVAMLTNAWHSRKTNERRAHTYVPLLVGAGALGACPALAARGSNASAIAALCVATAGVWSIYGPFCTLWTGLHRGEASATAMAVINSCGNVGGFVGPYILGVLGEGGEFERAFQVLAGMAVCAAILMMLYRFPDATGGGANIKFVQLEELKPEADDTSEVPCTPDEAGI